MATGPRDSALRLYLAACTGPRMGSGCRWHLALLKSVTAGKEGCLFVNIYLFTLGCSLSRLWRRTFYPFFLSAVSAAAARCKLPIALRGSAQSCPKKM